MVRPKPKSKRTPVRLRHKIEKASAAKQKKDRKLAKKDPTWRSRLKKDPGVPNLFPFKDRLLGEIEARRLEREEEKRAKREQQKTRRMEESAAAAAAADMTVDDEDTAFAAEDVEDMEGFEVGNDNQNNPMAALLASARARAAQYEAEEQDDEDDDAMEEDNEWNGISENEEDEDGDIAGATKEDTSRRTFDKVFKDVVEAADVVLYVLDARDPEGTRSKEVERAVMAAEGGDKRLILILNKIDLIPPKVLKGWLTHLRRYFPTIPLRASNPAPNAVTFDHKELTVKNTSTTLLKALKAYSQAKQLKRSISVGVIGYPNVGKSSVINALTSRLGRSATACPVGAEAGVTKVLRSVKIDNRLKLLDSPGIVFPSAMKEGKLSKVEEQARLILLNAVPPKQIEDPVPAVSLLLKRLSSSPELFDKLLEQYDVPPLMPSEQDQVIGFLVHVARKRGRLGKGGVPNIQSAAQTVVTDWRDGRIQGWIEAPVLAVSNVNGNGSIAGADQKEIVTEWAKEFKLDGLWGDGEEGAEAGEDQENVMQD